MAKQQQADSRKPIAGARPEEIAQIMSEIAGRSRVIIEEFLRRQGSGDGAGASMANLGQTFLELTQRMMTESERGHARRSSASGRTTCGSGRRTAQRMLGQEATR